MKVYVLVLDSNIGNKDFYVYSSRDRAVEEAAEEIRTIIDSEVMIDSQNKEFVEYGGERLYIPDDDHKLVEEWFNFELQDYFKMDVGIHKANYYE